MRIPADLTDPDLVLADCKRLLSHAYGVETPRTFWSNPDTGRCRRCDLEWLDHIGDRCPHGVKGPTE